MDSPDKEVKTENNSSKIGSHKKKLRNEKRARVIIRNISYKANEDDLRQHFQKYGEITEVKLLKRSDGKLVGCAFMQFKEVNQAAKAILKCTNNEFLGRKIYVDWAVGKDKYQEKNIKKNNNEGTSKSMEQEVKSSGNELGEGEPSNFQASVKEEESELSESDESRQGGDGSSEYEESIKEEKEDDDDSVCEDNKNNIKKFKKEISSSDVENGCTIFLKNIPFEATNNDVKEVCQKFGPIVYALINIDPISGHSKGTAFVKFKTKESADLLLSKSGNELMLMDSVLEPYPALSRKNIKEKIESSSKDHKNAKDSRNLYLAKEGLIMANSKAAEGVSASDMIKRHRLETVKTQILKNLNRFVSRNRLSIHNLPLSYDDEQLRKMIIKHTNLKPHECRVMRYNKPSIEYPKGKSKEFGFMSFKTHQDALAALRKLNNNPNVFGPRNRPIVAFSIEDRTVHNIKQKRLQKSKQNNPTYLKKLEKKKAKNKIMKTKQNIEDNKNNMKSQKKTSEKSHKVENKNENNEDFMGATSKPGKSLVRMRSNKKIQEQSETHAKTVGKLKRLTKQKKEKLIHLKEKRQKDRTKPKKLSNNANKNDKFSTLVEKYKKLIDTKANTEERSNVKHKKTKWYNG